MKVVVFPSDTTGCGLYRVRYPANAAIAAGVDITYGSQGEVGEGIPIEKITQGGKTYVRPLPIDADVIVLQRVADAQTLLVMGQLQQAGIAVVVENDDDLTNLHPLHPGASRLNPKTNPDCNWNVLRDACRQADMVTVTTDSLAKTYGKHGRVAVLPNCIPDRLLDWENQGDGKTVGWSGFTVTHPGDLRVTGGGVAEAVRRINGHFLMVGPLIGVKQQLGLHEEPECTGGLPDVEDYYRAMSRMDVGICPLADNRFNVSKSCLKPTEMAALGVVPVMSPRIEYVKLWEQGVGVLAEDRNRVWRRNILQLFEDESLRKELVEQGAAVVEEHYTIEKQVGRWIDAWEQAIVNRQKVLAVAA